MSNKENIYPEASQGAHIQNQPLATVSLTQLITLLKENQDSAFELEAYVTVPLPNPAWSPQPLQDWANELREVVHQACKYHFK